MVIMERIVLRSTNAEWAHDARKWDLRNDSVYVALLRSVKHRMEANLLLPSQQNLVRGVCAMPRFEPKDETILQAELAQFNRLNKIPMKKHGFFNSQRDFETDLG